MPTPHPPALPPLPDPGPEWEYTPDEWDSATRWTYTGRDGTDWHGVILTLSVSGPTVSA